MIDCISDESTNELYRSIRCFMTSLIPDLLDKDMHTMSLGLSHSLSRHKLKFSPDKVDIMIIQAINLLDDLDKEVNTYSMRLKEWYGWHFPEMTKMIINSEYYARTVLTMGLRTNAAEADLDSVLPEDMVVAVRAAAEVSMGQEITDDDLITIQMLATQVVEFTEYRTQLSEYLNTRMQAIAPNLTTLVGELVGARLIAHAGSLMNLAKSPASTIQILGAEKALFRALKTKTQTPKYGLIYHASLVGQATGGKNKGKIARMLAAKTALGLRMDSLADWGTEGKGEGEEPTEEEKVERAQMHRIKIERTLRKLEGRPLGAVGGAAIPPTQPPKFEIKEARKYNPAADALTPDSAAVAGAQEKKLIEVVNGADSDVDMKGGAVNGDAVNGETAESASDDAAKGTSKSGKKRKHEGEPSDDKAARKAMKKARHTEKEMRRAAKAAAGVVAAAQLSEEKVTSGTDKENDDRAARKLEKAARKEAKAEKRKRKAEESEGKAKKKHKRAVAD